MVGGRKVSYGPYGMVTVKVQVFNCMSWTVTQRQSLNQTHKPNKLFFARNIKMSRFVPDWPWNIKVQLAIVTQFMTALDMTRVGTNFWLKIGWTKQTFFWRTYSEF